MWSHWVTSHHPQAQTFPGSHLDQLGFSMGLRQMNIQILSTSEKKVSNLKTKPKWTSSPIPPDEIAAACTVRLIVPHSWHR